ncbi:MAG: hypothetical protein ACKVUT_08935 [Gaiella sp.]
MRTLRLLTIAALALTIVSSALAGGAAKGPRKSNAPKNLKAFLFKPSDAARRTFARTPSFSWSPVRGAICYEFELGTSRAFGENSLVWSNVQYGVGGTPSCKAVSRTGATDTASGGTASPPQDASTDNTLGDDLLSDTIPPLRVPAVSVDVALPWFTGNPYALYARVRAVTLNGATGWSKPFGFNMRWESTPTPLKGEAGLVRWTPIEGATGYQVWYLDAGKSFGTSTNVADQREYYAFHDGPEWISTVRWRVRAIRKVSGTLPNGLPAVTYGPWSPVFTHTNPALETGAMRIKAAISDRVSNDGKQAAHELMPGVTFAGTTSLGGVDTRFFRFYAFTDRDCVNVVFKGSIVAGPAYAPRSTGPLEMPATADAATKAATTFLKDVVEQKGARTADGVSVLPNENTKAAEGATEGSVVGAKTDLPDIDFPTTRYYWTVVPVYGYVDEQGAIVWTDLDLAQDACGKGRRDSFGKESDPVVTVGNGVPFVSGLSPSGRMVAARSKRPSLYGTPLVTWRPATAADAYEVQWSRTRYPWRAAGSVRTFATSALLDLKPGVWYYRVRGLNTGALGKAEMTWSSPVRVKIAAPTFSVKAG